MWLVESAQAGLANTVHSLPVVFSFLTGCVGQTYYSFQGVVGYSQGSGSEIKFKARCYSSFSSFLLKSVLNEIKGGSRVGERRDLTWKTRGNWTSAFSQKAVPIVSVYKSDRNVRICRNYKLTINRESETDWYLLPKQRDHFSILSGVKTSHNLIRLALTSNWCWKNHPEITLPLTLPRGYSITRDFASESHQLLQHFSEHWRMYYRVFLMYVRTLMMLWLLVL